jgi:truncated hemoglobin YjbI
VSEDHRAHVTQWWSEVFGGPAIYTDTLGGYEAMLAHHRGLAITPEDRLRFATRELIAAHGEFGEMDKRDAYRTTHKARCRGTPFPRVAPAER